MKKPVHSLKLFFSLKKGPGNLPKIQEEKFPLTPNPGLEELPSFWDAYLFRGF